MFLFLYLENNLCTILAGIQHHLIFLSLFFKETEVKKSLLYIVLLFIIYFLFLLFSTGKTLWTDENRMKMKQNDGEKCMHPNALSNMAEAVLWPGPIWLQWSWLSGDL